MKILLNSGVVKYINIFFFLSLFFAFLSVLVGFIFFGFFVVSFSSLYLIGYLFRTEDRVLNKNLMVSPTDGKVTSIHMEKELPDFINKQNITYKGNYTVITIRSFFNDTYYKYAPADCYIEQLNIFPPQTISKHSNFKHKNYRTYISFKLRLKGSDTNGENFKYVIIVMEILFADKNYDIYNLYVKVGDELNKGDMLVCSHFYSMLWIYLEEQELNIQKGQSLFYKETSLLK